MKAHGAAIAWLANEADFSDPPSLFKGDQLLAALSDPTGYAGGSGVGEEAQFLAPEVREVLQHEVRRLVNLDLPDPDDVDEP